RSVILRQHIYWRGLGLYAIGAGIAFVLVSQLHYVPAPVVVFLTLGIVPFAARALPALDFQNPWMAVLCGFLVAGLQMLVGVAGPLLDVFFIDTKLNRNQ